MSSRLREMIFECQNAKSTHTALSASISTRTVTFSVDSSLAMAAPIIAACEEPCRRDSYYSACGIPVQLFQ